MEKIIRNEVEKNFDQQILFLQELVKYPSLRGQEESAQNFLAKELSARGYEIDRWCVDVDEIAHYPGFSPVIGNYENAVNLVATHRPNQQKGRSLILNGHIDVVPEGPCEMWSRDPFDPHIEENWMYGRGAGDMKAGLIANLFAFDALKACGFAPAAPVYFQSVVEEECTGNGTLACLARGYKADAALIPEPFDEKLVNAQVGVIWFQVHLQGLPTHVAYAGAGSNAIEAALPLWDALHKMEERWNEAHNRHICYQDHHHALNLNIGKIQGGDWTSSVPAWCVFDVRMGIFPDQNIQAAKEEIETVLHEAAQTHPFLRKNTPKIIYHGFQAEGYALEDDISPQAKSAIKALENAHFSVNGKELEKLAITATTDARFFGLYQNTPALVYGPRAEAIHGFDERVCLDSLLRITQSTALFIANWCGVEAIS